MKDIRISILIILGFMLYLTSNAQVSDGDKLKSVCAGSKTLIMDVRTLSEFAQEHMIGTFNLPLQNLSDTTWYKSLRYYDNIIIVCKSGVRAAKAKKLLEDYGFTNLYNGGGWKSLQQLLAVEEEEFPELIPIR